MAKETKQIGVIRIDTARCWIGDPCYFEEAQKASSEEKYSPSGYGHWKDCDGLGMVIQTGWGDGIYPVFATFDEEGSVAEVRVRFLPHPAVQNDR